MPDAEDATANSLATSGPFVRRAFVHSLQVSLAACVLFDWLEPTLGSGAPPLGASPLVWLLALAPLLWALACLVGSAEHRWGGAGRPRWLERAFVVIALGLVAAIVLAGDASPGAKVWLAIVASIGVAATMASGVRVDRTVAAAAASLALRAAALLWLRAAPEQAVIDVDSIAVGLNAFNAALLIAASVSIQPALPLQRLGDAVSIAALLLLLVFLLAIQGMERGRDCVPGSEPPESRRAAATAGPDVIFVVWDTVRSRNLGLYGYALQTTPRLEALARESRVYTRAIAPSPWTLPSHGSMLTGLPSRTHGARKPVERPQDPGQRTPGLAEDRRTLAEDLAERGYRTASISANLFLGPAYGLDQGFEIACNPLNPNRMPGSPRVPLHAWLTDALLARMPVSWVRRFALPHADAREVFERGLAYFDSVEQEASVFLFLNLMDAHDPVMPPTEYSAEYPGWSRDLYGVWHSDLDTRLEREARSLSNLERTHLVAQYDAAIRYLDEELHRFIEGLKARGRFDRSLLIVTSDHGEAFGDHGLLGHGREVYGELVDVPLVVRFPRGERAGTEEAWFENRLLFDLVRAEVGSGAPLEPRASAVAEVYPNWTGGPRNEHVRRAFHFDDHKFIASSSAEHELYHLSVDPREEENLYARDVPAAKRGRELEARFLREAPAAAPPSGADLQPLDDAARAHLRALGYIE